MELTCRAVCWSGCGELFAEGRRTLDSTAEKHVKEMHHAVTVWCVPVAADDPLARYALSHDDERG